MWRPYKGNSPTANSQVLVKALMSTERPTAPADRSAYPSAERSYTGVRTHSPCGFWIERVRGYRGESARAWDPPNPQTQRKA